jgi:hypothetical protein
VATRADLPGWVEEALALLGGTAPIAAVAREIWTAHERELRGSGELFYTWQYDMRWAAYRLRKSRRIKPMTSSPRGWWELTANAMNSPPPAPNR